jgi:hypothetical protein
VFKQAICQRGITRPDRLHGNCPTDRRLVLGNPQAYQEKLQIIDQVEATLSANLQAIDGQIHLLQNESKNLQSEIDDTTVEMKNNTVNVYKKLLERNKQSIQKQLKVKKIDIDINNHINRKTAYQSQLQELHYDRQQYERQLDAAERERFLTERWPFPHKPSAAGQLDLLRTQHQYAAIEQEISDLSRQRDGLYQQSKDLRADIEQRASPGREIRQYFLIQWRLRKVKQKLHVLCTDQVLLQTELQVQQKMGRPSPVGKQLVSLREQQDKLRQDRTNLQQELAGKGWIKLESFQASCLEWHRLQQRYRANACSLRRVEKEIQKISSKPAVIQDQMKSAYAPYQTNQEILDDLDQKATPVQNDLHSIEQHTAGLREKRDALRRRRQDAQTEIDPTRIFSSKAMEYLRSQWRLHKAQRELQALTTKQKSLQAWMQRELITPADKVYVQAEKHVPAFKNMLEIRNQVVKEAAKYRPSTTSEALTGDTALLRQQIPFADIDTLLTQVRSIQAYVHQTAFSSDKLRKHINTLATNIQQLHDAALATRTALDEQYTILTTYATKLEQELNVSRDLGHNLIGQTPMRDYNPYYLMNRVQRLFNIKAHQVSPYHAIEDPVLPRPPHHLSEQKVGIDATGPRSCVVKATRRGLSILGRDIENDATEDKIAELVQYSTKSGGTDPSNTCKAYQHYGFDYVYVDKEIVTIYDMERVTRNGGVIHAGVAKYGGVGSHNWLVERVERIGDDKFSVTFYDPYHDQIETLHHKEFEKFLDERYTLPANWQQ